MTEPRKATPRELLAYVTARMRAEKFAPRSRNSKRDTPFSALEERFRLSHPVIVEIVNQEAKSVGPKTVAETARVWFGGSKDQLEIAAAAWADEVGWQDEEPDNDKRLLAVARARGFTESEATTAKALVGGARGYLLTDEGAFELLQRARQYMQDTQAVVQMKALAAARSEGGSENKESAIVRIQKTTFSIAQNDPTEDLIAEKRSKKKRPTTP